MADPAARPRRYPPAADVVSTHTAIDLRDGWHLVAAEEGAHPDPVSVDWNGSAPGVVPGTVAQAVGPADLDAHDNYDAHDWFYRTTVTTAPAGAGERLRLRFDGLATLAEVWLNGDLILTADNMFRSWVVDVTDRIRADNELVVVFRSLTRALDERRPRPRWKTRLVENQRLRWFRTTLLGRIPGWTPAIAPVGPWKPISLERATVVDCEEARVWTSVTDGAGRVRVRARMMPLKTPGAPVVALVLDGDRYPLTCSVGDDGAFEIDQEVNVGPRALWWPATHGDPALHDAWLRIDLGPESVRVDCGALGFRTVEVDRTDGRVEYLINGEPVFCRGSCWSSNDIVSLTGSDDDLTRSLRLFAEAGGNMLRVGGTMVYESDRFYALCDQLGIMVWQDFMFANLDYPADDADFTASVSGEVRGQLARLSPHPSVVTWCGNSEIEQQAAMFGAAPGLWSNELFRQWLPDAIREEHPGVPYWPSTPTEGALPFHVGEGLAHYFGVGAYRRPLDDVRLADVRFSPECLGFSNVPCDRSLKDWNGGSSAPHEPAWKRGVPRDSGAGWDFEDIRDHYLERLYGVDAVDLRSRDTHGYLALSRAVTGHVMAHVFDEWRSGGRCGGGLTWFYQDLRPGAGWGIVDSLGRPKAAYFHLKRAWAPQAIRVLDRGLDGVLLSVVNDESESLQAEVEVLLMRGGTATARSLRAVRVPPRSVRHLGGDETLEYFTDSTYAYRFGPQQHDVVVARLWQDGEVLAEHTHVPDRTRPVLPATVRAVIESVSDDTLELQLETDAVAYDVRVSVRDHEAADNHFDLTPGHVKRVRLLRTGGRERAFRGVVEGANLVEGVRLVAPS